MSQAPVPPHGPEAVRVAALHMLAAWMGERFFRTFRLPDDDPAPYDALVQQRDRRIGVTLGLLWGEEQSLAGADDFAEMLSADMASEPGIEDGAYAIWVPPRATLPREEPGRRCSGNSGTIWSCRSRSGDGPSLIGWAPPRFRCPKTLCHTLRRVAVAPPAF
jgi:hypothetical protein